MTIPFGYRKPIVVLICLVYSATRFWHLTDSCLWFDEIFSAHAAEHSWDSILSFVALDLIHPPLFYVILKLWIAIGGDGLFWLRLLPVVFSIVALLPFWKFLKELKLNDSVVALSLFLLTVNGSVLKYSQELRMYSMLMCIFLISMWLFIRYINRGLGFVPLVLVNLLLVYTHYFGWLVLLSEVAILFYLQPSRWRRALSMVAVVGVGFMPWAAAVFEASRSGTGLGQNIGWMQRPGFLSIFQLVLGLIEPFYYQASSIEPVSIFAISLPLLIIGAISAVSYALRWKHHDAEERKAVPTLLIFLKLPVITVFFASWLLPFSFWGTRHLLIVFVPFFILLAIAIASISIRTLKVAGITLLVLFSVYAFIITAMKPAANYSWCAWEPLVAESLNVDNTNIYTVEDLTAYHIWFDIRKGYGTRLFRITNIDGVAEDKAYFLPRGFNDVISIDFAAVNEKKLWLAFRSNAIKETEPPLRNLLVNGYRISDKKIFKTDGEEVGMFQLER